MACFVNNCIILAVKKLLIMRFTDIERSPRTLKQIFWAKGLYDITVVGFGNFKDKDVEFIQIDKPSESLLQKLKRKLYISFFQFEKFYWSLPFVQEAYKKLNNRKFDLIVAIDLQTLPLAVSIRKGAPILFDAPEFFLEDDPRGGLAKALYKRYSNSLLAKYLPEIQILTSQSKSFSDLYREMYGVKTAEILNVPFYHQLKPTTPSGPRLRLVHHGVAQANRNLEAIIKGCGAVSDKCELHLYLIEDSKDKKYYKKIITLASKFENIFLHKPVPYSQLIKELNQYDLGVYMLKPIDSQTAYTLPNKLFDFIQARLGLVISDQPAMKSIVAEHDIGVVVQGYDAETLSKVLSNLELEEVMRFKYNSDIAASYFCAENFKEHYLRLLKEIQR